MMKLRSFVFIIAISLFGLSGCLFSDFFDDRFGGPDHFKVLITADREYFYLAPYTFNQLTDTVADKVNHSRTRIERVSIADGTGFGVIYAGALAPLNPSSTNGILTAARFTNIQAMTFASDKNSIFLIDGAKLRQFNLTTGSVSTLINSGLTSSLGIAYSEPENMLYLTQGSKIRRVNLADNSITDFAGDASTGDVDDTGLNARFSSLGAMTLLGDHLYFLDIGNSKIKKISLASGVVSTLAGSGVLGDKDGVGTDATLELTEESQLTTDSKQIIFFTELNGVRTLHAETKEIKTVLPLSRSLFDAIGKVNEDGGIYRPTGLYYLNKILYAVNPYGIKTLQ